MSTDQQSVRSWQDIDPKDAVDLDLSKDTSIDAPLNENGERRRAQNGAAGKRYRATAKGKSTRGRNLADAKGNAQPEHHGTATGYHRYGCRCDACRAAHAEENRGRSTPLTPERQESRRQQRASLSPEENRRRWLKQYHRMTPADWQAMWDEQEGCCWLCGDPLEVNGSAKRPSIDHDHTCCPRNYSCAKCRRGLACHPCNMILGNAQDDPERLRRIADRLERSQILAGLAVA